MRAVYYSHAALDFKPQWGATVSHRIVTKDRGKAYNKSGVAPSIPLGFIPQVAHTYAYFDANYGVMNEHQLSIGECTDKAKVHPEPEPGKRIFYSAELSRVALERTKTAREAIKLMGELIEKYGYYGTGETLLVADPNEGWVMEMAGYDMNGTGGVWVAQGLVAARLAPGVMEPQGVSDLLTPVFSILVVFVLAEVFREGARLRRESELTI